MKSASRRSFLQVQILHRLEQGPARTVTELAEAVGAQRPSVSRSLKTLRGDKLVTRRRNGWTATSTGKEEAKRCNQELSRITDDLRHTLTDSLRHTLAGIKEVTSVGLAQGGKPISESLMEGILSKTMGNIALAPRGIKDALPTRFAEPSLPAGELGETARVTLSPISGRDAPKELLERLLADLNLDLVDKWKGSWQALSDSNPDRLSQAAFSYRELIRMVLDELAPSIDSDPSERRSKRKMQARQILGGREADFAETMVEGLPRLYDLLSKCAHTSYRDKGVVHGALMAGDGLLQMLLSSRRPALS